MLKYICNCVYVCVYSQKTYDSSYSFIVHLSDIQKGLSVMIGIMLYSPVTLVTSESGVLR